MRVGKRLTVWLPLVFVLVPSLARAQTPAGATLALETNRFYSDQGPVLVEGALEIPYALLSFDANGDNEADGDNLHAQAKVEVMIDREGGRQVYHSEREITPFAVNDAMANSTRVTTLETFAIYAPSGEYIARARVTDLKNTRMFEMSVPLTIPETAPLFSDIVLSNHIQKDVQLQEGSYLPYLIGTTMFNANPRKVFYKDAPLVYFYYEVNPEVLGIDGERIDVDLSITDTSGAIVKTLGLRAIEITQDRNFDIGAFSVAGLAAGEYRLVAVCSECPQPHSVYGAFEVQPPRQQLAFLNPEPAGTEMGDLEFYADFSDAQADSIFEIVDVLLTSDQRQLVEALNREGKITFLNRFWDSLDPVPETAANEFKQEFEQRVAYSDQFYTTLQGVGHKTPRGEIYLLYGEPTEVIDRPFEATSMAYIIWNYTSPGQTFAFGDFGKNGNYRLIYSTDRRFPGDPQIQSLVESDTSTSNPAFVRAGRGYGKVINDIRFYRTGGRPTQ
jgi:GWxTD domain-containing protein